MKSTNLLPAVQAPLATAMLADLASKINEAHHQAEAAMNSGLRHALEAGRLLLEAKAQIDHGQWLPWLKANFQGSARTARAYVRIVKRYPLLKAKRQRAANLSIREVTALTTTRPPRDKIGCVTRATRYLRRALEEATTIEEVKAIRDLALDAQNTAAEEVLRMERVLGQELTKLQEQPPAAGNLHELVGRIKQTVENHQQRTDAWEQKVSDFRHRLSKAHDIREVVLLNHEGESLGHEGGQLYADCNALDCYCKIVMDAGHRRLSELQAAGAGNGQGAADA